MLVRIKGHGNVDVVDRDCAKRDCFVFGFDKGSYTPGRGYTSYREKALPVCLTRMVHGCPHPGVCPLCRTAARPGQTVCRYPECGGTIIPRNTEVPHG